MNNLLLLMLLLASACGGDAAPDVPPVVEEKDEYTLVWQDEFDGPGRTMPDAGQWYYETGGHGWGNNELQNYIAGTQGRDTFALVSDGTLKIIAAKKEGEVFSVRLNTRESWTYGYFEARLKLPTGKGTWPAFWMMPKAFKHWPADGEIDIMEEVGYRPNWTSSAIHCQAYNHAIQTQKTGEQFIRTAQTDFHVYALEWMKLNLAWGGNWGGAEGVDESCLPATYEIDYVRVYQRKKR